jgi:hypothetical protein
MIRNAVEPIALARTLAEYRMASARDLQPEPACEVPECGRPPYADGLCKRHADEAWYHSGAGSSPLVRCGQGRGSPL